MTTKNKFFSIRLPEDIAAQLRAEAQANTRTLAAQILHYIKLGLAKKK